MSVLAIDIETKNMSHEIGGWNNTHMFQVSTVATWDGNKGVVYVDEPVDCFAKTGIEVKPLSVLKYDLDEHYENGGRLLGHNIVSFDLPVLRDSMDIYCIRKYIQKKAYIDTSSSLVSGHGKRIRLNNLVKHSLGDSKTMDSADAPLLWKQGDFNTVTEYCLKDTQLVYDLWRFGQKNGYVSAYDIDEEIKKQYEVKWK